MLTFINSLYLILLRPDELVFLFLALLIFKLLSFFVVYINNIKYLCFYNFKNIDMPIILQSLMRALLYFGSGIGVTSMIDKFIPDKLPAGVGPLSNTADQTGKTNWLKIGLIILAGAIGIMLVKFIGKKFKISLLK